MICSLEDLDIYYETYGEGRPILMIHGYTMDHHVMTGCMEPIFSKRPGWKRIYIDLPGMGLTKSKGWIVNSDVMLDILLRFIDMVMPDSTFLVAGESYGGYLARGIVYKRPESVDGILMICPVIVADRQKRDLPPRIALKREPGLVESLGALEKKNFEKMVTVQTSSTWERFNEDIMPGIRLDDASFTGPFQQYGYPFSFDVDSLVEPFSKPALLLTGRQDSVVGYKDAWGLLMDYPRATFAVLDMAGHCLQIEQEFLFRALVHDWLDRVLEHTG